MGFFAFQEEEETSGSAAPAAKTDQMAPPEQGGARPRAGTWSLGHSRHLAGPPGEIPRLAPAPAPVPGTDSDPALTPPPPHDPDTLSLAPTGLRSAPELEMKYKISAQFSALYALWEFDCTCSRSLSRNEFEMEWALALAD